MRSGTAISETIVVALNSETNWLSASGSMRRTTCGRMMRHRISRSDMPNGAAGLDVALRDRLDAGAERLGEVAAVDEAERDHRRDERVELDAPPEQQPDQQRQHEMDPDHHDVVGRVAEHLDVQRADPAHRPAAVDAQQRGAEPDRERDARGAGEDLER